MYRFEYYVPFWVLCTGLSIMYRFEYFAVVFARSGPL